MSSIINLTENKLEFGTHYFDISFNHISSLFHLHSLFKTPFTDNFFYQIGPLSIIIFVNTFLIEKIFNRKKNDYLDHVFYLYLFCLVFVNVFFYRLAEHGTDRSAQILFFLTFLLCLTLAQYKTIANKTFEIITITFTLIVTLKSFYILYSILLLLIYFKFFRVSDFFKFIKKFPIIYLCLLTLFLMLINSLAVSGCFIYPVVATCGETFFWGYGKEKVLLAMEWYEVWSKAGASPTYRVENYSEYIRGLNWLPNWFDNYFFNKVSDYLLGILLVILIFIISFKIKILKLKDFKNYNSFYFILILLFLEWFLNHPALRYGGYVLIYLIIVMPVAVLLSNQKYTFKKKLKPIKIIFCITIIVFASRNINRLINENSIYDYNLLKNPVYNIQSNYFNMQNRKESYFVDPKMCDPENSKKDLICKKIKSFNFYYKN